MASREQTLPAKEAALFRQIVKFYETKQYKKGIKAADQVLRKHAEHGETLAMKGLILNCQEKKEDAYELVRRGLKSDLKSHVCWHVYGLLYRSDRNYDEAIKCYKNALRIDKENIQILRDLAQLQVQMRDIPGFIDTRAQLLHLKPASRPNWITFAIAHHLNQNYELAVQALAAFEGTQEEVSAPEAYEHSEMLMYKAMILEEGGLLEEALQHLDNHKNSIRDQLGWLEQRSRLLLRVGRMDDAAVAYRELLASNADNYCYHEGLQAALNLQARGPNQHSAEHRQQLSKLYRELAADFPASKAVRRIPLDFLEGPEFEAAAEAYVRPFLEKGIPSLFSSLKALYRIPAKVDMLGGLFQRVLDEEDGHKGIAADNHEAARQQPNGEATDSGHGEQDPHLWTLFYLAQHYDRMGRTGEALAALALCEERAPKLPDILSARVRVLKHAGDQMGAAAAAVNAQQFDLSDRYLNSAAAKALFRAGDIQAAERMAARFTKDGDQPNNLTDMQAMWYEIEAGTAHARLGQHGMALKRLLAVRAHFDDFVEDQFDFHSYCVRKMTLRAYVAMLRMEDRLHRNALFVKAAGAAVAVYLALDKAPAAAVVDAEAERAAQGAMSAEERKKLRQKQRKPEAKLSLFKQEQQKQQKKEREAQGAASAASTKEGAAAKKGSKDGTLNKEDPDPHGAALAGHPDPLGEAAKLVRLLRENAADQLHTHNLAFEVYMRRGRLLLALQAVQRAVALDAASPVAHRLLTTLAHAVRDAPAHAQAGHVPNGVAMDASRETPHGLDATAAVAPDVVRTVVDAHVARMLGGQTLEAYCQAWAQQHSSQSMVHRAAAARAAALLHPNDKAGAVSLLLEGDPFAAAELHHADCMDVHTLLGGPLADAAAAQQWHKRCQLVFPWSQYFDGPKRWQLEAVDGTRVHEASISVNS